MSRPPAPRACRYEPPTKAAVEAAAGSRMPDVLGPGVRVLFCGINPSLYSAAVGHHFARPGNRFWPAVHGGGFTPRRLHPSEDGLLVTHGCGITNLAPRATRRADELHPDELTDGAATLEEKIETRGVRVLAVLGITAYRTAFGEKRAAIGPQPAKFGGAAVWVLPNPSGLNAHYKPADFARLFAELRAGTGGGG